LSFEEQKSARAPADGARGLPKGTNAALSPAAPPHNDAGSARDLPLFRDEVMRARAQRLEGEVVALHAFRHWLLIAAFGGILLLLVTAATIVRYSRSEVLEGVVLPRIPLVKVYCAKPGVIRSLLVSEGQSVRAGDILARVDTDEGGPEGRPVGEIDSGLADTGEQLARDQLSYEGDKAEAQRSELLASIRGLEEQGQRLRSQILHQVRLVELAKEAVEAVEAVRAKGYISRDEYQRRVAEALRNEQQLDVLRGQLASNAADLAKTRSTLRADPAARGQRRSELLAAINEATRVRLRAGASREYVIRASTGGTVTAVNLAVGDRADPSTPLLTLVPNSAGMFIRAAAPSSAAGFIKAGQAVRVRYDAFPYERYGSFGGVVENVSRTVVMPGEGRDPLKLTDPAYRVSIAIDGAETSRAAAGRTLQPGMKARVSVPLERRSILSWFLPSLPKERH
jgi:membrane fusion protein